MGRTLKRCSLLLFIIPVLYGQGVTGNGGGGSSSGGSSPGSPGVPQCVQTNSVTVTGVIVETTLTGTCGGTGSFTLPANFFSAAGSILRVHADFNFVATAAASNLRIRLGGTQIIVASINPAAATYNCNLELALTARTVGAGGTIMADGPLNCISTANAAGNLLFNILVTPVTINTTTTEVFDFTITPGAVGWSATITDLVLAGY